MMFGRIFGKDVSWDGEKYTLVDTIRFAGSPFATEHLENYNYVCMDLQSVNTTECAEVYYYSSYSDYAYGIRLTNGAKIGDMFTAINANTNNSLAKTVVDNWFTNNITTNTDALEDVVYCNDRSTHMSYGGGKAFWLYDGFSRILGIDNSGVANPSVDCTSRNDSFTVGSEKGNGALTYPAALLTGDEMVLAGFCMSTRVDNSIPTDYADRCIGQAGDNYLDDSSSYFTMTPLMAGWNNNNIARGNNINWIDYSSAGGSTGRYRPVIALKYNTEVEGTGTQADPYRIKE